MPIGLLACSAIVVGMRDENWQRNAMAMGIGIAIILIFVIAIWFVR